MKLFVTLAAILAATAQLASSPACAQSLTGATVRFHTNDDDRPRDSVLEFSVFPNKGNVLFTGSAPNEAYEPNTDHTLVLQVPSGVEKSQFAKSFLLVHFQPSGRDALKFNFTMELTFSDNSKIVGTWNQLFLDQDHRDFTGSLYLP